ncbi:interleukin-12 receptor subunit beta-1 isoform X2 [Hyperolius riggenbachi]|uniref:interleukin-12 receptor subunit beta-1 isoform X2 n=1 Tax=Hyperolius riggenbachi TaxID=752182 RepID=UPI0035A3CBE8
MMLAVTYCNLRISTGIKVILWVQLIIFVTADQQTGMSKKIPTDLTCYQNYTLKNKFCICSWKAGNDSQNATYTLNYSEDGGDSFEAGEQTYIIIDGSQIHFKQQIDIWLEAHEGEHIYLSENVTMLLDRAVKLDPPHRRNFTINKNGRFVTVHWTRIGRFSQSMKTRKEVQYKENNYSVVRECDLNQSSKIPNCYDWLMQDTILPLCKEYCTLHLDDKEHNIQIRQRYEEGVWSEWSESAFIPADIRCIQEANYTERKLKNIGIRTLKLGWKCGTENQGGKTYDIDFNLLACPDARWHYQTNDNWLNRNISGAAYNVTIIASNQVEKSPPWSLIIQEDFTEISFERVEKMGKQLTMEWKKEARKHSYCTEWKLSANNGIIFGNLTRNESNQTNLFTDVFEPMQCYRISIYELAKDHHRTVGTTYYFRPSLDISPGNLTVVKVTSHSVLLKWDDFDLQMCHGLLRNWEIVITDHTRNISRTENSSVTQHLVDDLSLGFSCTFHVHGITVYGEYTGSSSKSVSLVSSDSTKIYSWLPIVVVVLIGLPIVCCKYFTGTRLRMYLFPNIPDPSNATIFVSSDNKNIVNPKHLIDTSSENKQMDTLTIESSLDMKYISMIASDTERNQMDPTCIIPNNDISEMAESELENDLQSEYRKQVVVVITPEKEALIPEFNKLKDDNLKENHSLLSICE